MCEPLLFGSPSAPITLPRASSPLLIWMLSFNLSPLLPVFRMRSEPARSTKWNLEATTWLGAPEVLEPLRRCSMITFTCVAPLCRAVLPVSRRLRTSSRPSTSHSFTPHRTEDVHTI
uniref:Uncharacterized protein n=1 Tax=Paramormyrops kingsleyae TaxID=1676925 RepID=A0A3B3SXF1_9TELE